MLNTHGYLYGQMHEIDNLNKRVSDLVIRMGLMMTVGRQDGLDMLRGNNPLQEGFGEDRSSMFESRCVGVTRKDLIMLKRSVFRITRGNSWVTEL